MFSTSAPAAAFQSFLPEALESSVGHTTWDPADGPAPSLYISHGAPPLFEDVEWIDRLFAWSLSLPKPRGIVIVSAHWEQAPACVSATGPQVPLVYDFGGFHPFYYAMQYPTPDATWLASRVMGLLPYDAVQHAARGLDHGAWVPLMVMYPRADVPVVQVSIPAHDPDALLALGRRLRELRQEGIAIIGSGFLTHGLPFLTAEDLASMSVPGWSRDFAEWATDAIASGDVDRLARFRAEGPGMPYAHPTVEHFTPMFVTLGASTDVTETTTGVDGFVWGLSRFSFAAA